MSVDTELKKLSAADLASHDELINNQDFRLEQVSNVVQYGERLKKFTYVKNDNEGAAMRVARFALGIPTLVVPVVPLVAEVITGNHDLLEKTFIPAIYGRVERTLYFKSDEKEDITHLGYDPTNQISDPTKKTSDPNQNPDSTQKTPDPKTADPNQTPDSTQKTPDPKTADPNQNPDSTKKTSDPNQTPEPKILSIKDYFAKLEKENPVAIHTINGHKIFIESRRKGISSFLVVPSGKPDEAKSIIISYKKDGSPVLEETAQWRGIRMYLAAIDDIEAGWDEYAEESANDAIKALESAGKLLNLDDKAKKELKEKAKKQVKMQLMCIEISSKNKCAYVRGANLNKDHRIGRMIKFSDKTNKLIDDIFKMAHQDEVAGTTSKAAPAA
jgi:hypothetical protein